MKILQKTMLGLAGLMALNGCANFSTLTDQALANKISQDAIRLNEAFNRSTNAVILKNILRARDRWTVNFTTLSGIRSRPTSKLSGSLGLSPLGLGNADGPLKDSSAGLGGSRGTDNEYSINPFSNNDNSQSLLTPTPFNLFKRYYETGWPQDVVFLLFVRSLSYTNDNGEDVHIFNNGDKYPQFIEGLRTAYGYENGQKLDLKTDFVLKSGQKKAVKCAVQNLSTETFLRRFEAHGSNLEKFESVTGNTLKVSPSKSQPNQLKLEICPKASKGPNTFVLAETAKYKTARSNRGLRFKLRSFEDIIYYLGEVMREAPNNRPQAKSPCNSEMGPIFEIYEGKTQKAFGSSVIHNGQAYYALPQLGYSKTCTERTSTSMAILNQLLLLNQSKEFLTAPQNYFR